MFKLKDLSVAILVTVLTILIMFFILSFSGGKDGMDKIIFITLLSLISMNIAIAIPKDKFLNMKSVSFVWLLGVSSGAMLMSSSVFILPTAISQNSKFGSIGVGLGFLIGYIIHTISHNSSHMLNNYLEKREEVAYLTIHTIFTASILGIIYSQTPTISLILGIAVISHKLPASISTSSRLIENNESVYLILVPSIFFAISIFLSFYFKPEISSVTSSIIFGIGTGVFLHLAMDLLPECSQGKLEDVVSQTEKEHQKLDKLRYHSMISVFSGAFVVFLLWFLLV